MLKGVLIGMGIGCLAAICIMQIVIWVDRSVDAKAAALATAPGDQQSVLDALGAKWGRRLEYEHGRQTFAAYGAEHMVCATLLYCGEGETFDEAVADLRRQYQRVVDKEASREAEWDEKHK